MADLPPSRVAPSDRPALCHRSDAAFHCAILFCDRWHLAPDSHSTPYLSFVISDRLVVELAFPAPYRFLLYHYSHSPVISLADSARRLGDKLYIFCYPIYHPLYSLFKSYADRAERALLRKMLEPGSVVVVAGANIG